MEEFWECKGNSRPEVRAGSPVRQFWKPSSVERLEAGEFLFLECSLGLPYQVQLPYANQPQKEGLTEVPLHLLSHLCSCLLTPRRPWCLLQCKHHPQWWLPLLAFPGTYSQGNLHQPLGTIDQGSSLTFVTALCIFASRLLLATKLWFSNVPSLRWFLNPLTIMLTLYRNIPVLYLPIFL